ncbi:hypothetical protein JW935_04160, partial [candidate division KSB1 bacterium]|nr:hypothetical protein [candidate division KSB1 bacterium]
IRHFFQLLLLVEWGRQYAFPASKYSIDPLLAVVQRNYLYGTVIEKAGKKNIRVTGICKHTWLNFFFHFPHAG